jgi:hypothetical protein
VNTLGGVFCFKNEIFVYGREEINSKGLSIDKAQTAPIKKANDAFKRVINYG